MIQELKEKKKFNFIYDSRAERKKKIAISFQGRGSHLQKKEKYF